MESFTISPCGGWGVRSGFYFRVGLPCLIYYKLLLIAILLSCLLTRWCVCLMNITKELLEKKINGLATASLYRLHFWPNFYTGAGFKPQQILISPESKSQHFNHSANQITNHLSKDDKLHGRCPLSLPGVTAVDSSSVPSDFAIQHYKILLLLTWE